MKLVTVTFHQYRPTKIQGGAGEIILISVGIDEVLTVSGITCGVKSAEPHDRTRPEVMVNQFLRPRRYAIGRCVHRARKPKSTVFDAYAIGAPGSTGLCQA